MFENIAYNRLQGVSMPTLDWIGKKAVVNHHREVPYRLIHCDSDLSEGDPDARNLLVQGDNLEALKALLPYYAGKIKCIYIDPPFNTGSEDWMYNDNNNDPTISSWLGNVVKGEGDDLTRHDKWLCMMYPRVRLLRDFLTDDGTLFLHIDDNELSYAVALFDEIFGRKNRAYVVAFKQASATGHKSINPGCVNIMNNIVIYARDRDKWKPNRVFTAQARDKRYGNWIENIDDDYKNWKIVTLTMGFAKSLGVSATEARSIAKDDPEKLNQFVLDNARQVVQLARPDYNNVGQETREMIDRSNASPKEYFRVERPNHSDIYLVNGKRIIFYSDKVKVIDGTPVSGEPLTTLWDDLLSNNIHNEGGVEFPKGKKPEALIKRCIELAATKGSKDIVMDTFAGSGTTAAVAHKMGFNYVTVEMGEHATTHVSERLRGVISGSDQSGITKDVNWLGGGGFRFCRLGNALFDEYGDVAQEVTFSDLAAHIFFSETGSPIPKRATSEFIGKFEDRAVYLLFDAANAETPRETFGNVLTLDKLNDLPDPPEGFEGTKVVYAEGCTVSTDRLKAAGAVFKQIPYQVEGA